MYWPWIFVALWLMCSAAVLVLFFRATNADEWVDQESVPDEIERLINSSHRCLDHLKAYENRMMEAHKMIIADMDDHDRDDLRRVIRDRESYKETMQAIQDRKRRTLGRSQSIASRVNDDSWCPKFWQIENPWRVRR